VVGDADKSTPEFVDTIKDTGGQMTDDNVIDINKAKLERGELMFLCCPNCEGQDFGVVVVQGNGSHCIAGLVCSSDECQGEGHIQVIGGMI
jgi:hypothetical protein